MKRYALIVLLLSILSLSCMAYYSPDTIFTITMTKRHAEATFLLSSSILIAIGLQNIYSETHNAIATGGVLMGIGCVGIVGTIVIFEF